MLLKTKDYVTLGNILGGIFSIYFAIESRSDWSFFPWCGWAIFIALWFDIADGLVARLMKQFNNFGAELDNIGDLVTYSVAPTFMIYVYYTTHPTLPHMPWYLAGALASLPAITGCIRIARFNVKRLHYEGAWMGFPRTASALLYIGYFNMSSADTSLWVYYGGIVVVVASSIMHFVLLPYYNHHRHKHPTYMWVSFWFIGSSSLLAAFGAFFTGINLTFEVITFWLLLYLFAHRPISFTRAQLKEIRAYVKEWKKEESSELSGAKH